MIFLALTCQSAVTLERSVSISEAARFTVLAFAFEVQLGSPSEQGALAGVGTHDPECIGAPVLAVVSGCRCKPNHNMTHFSTQMLFG